MRTTVTSEPDLAARLRSRARENETSFKAALNDALRRGLQEDQRTPAAPFVQRSSTMGFGAGIDLTKASRLAGELEDAERVRKSSSVVASSRHQRSAGGPRRERFRPPDGEDLARAGARGPRERRLRLGRLLGFVRVSTNPRIYAEPLHPNQALDQTDEWLAAGPAAPLHPGPEHAVVLRRLLAESGTAGNLTTDAHIAALAIENGATLASFDGDFHRFGKLRLEHLR